MRHEGAPSRSILVDQDDAPAESPQLSLGLLARMGALAVLLGLEVIGFSIAFDTASLSRSGFIGFIGDWSPVILRGGIAFLALFGLLLFQTAKPIVGRIDGQLRGRGVSSHALFVHAGSMLALFVLSRQFFGGGWTGMAANWLAVGWLIAGVIGVVAGIVALIPVPLFLELVRSTTLCWISAAVGGVLTCFAASFSQGLWLPAQTITFHLSAIFLRPLLPNLFLDPATNAIGTKKFFVEIAPGCSGIEGVGLMLVFSAIWLWLCRKECRFPQVLIAIPASAALVFLLNSVRIAVLVLIGNAGAQEIALGGFHSQAGWITFNITAIALMLVLRRIPWFVTPRAEVVHEQERVNDPTIRYLAPFLAILVASMISKAASGEFEYAYPLRFLAGAAVLLAFRKQYADLDWRVGWMGPMAGVSVFAIWSGWDMLHPSAASGAIVAGLGSLPSWARLGWISCRILAPILTVPVAEELAFRGYLTRRVMAESFSCVDFRSISIVAILVSSAAFGALHGSRWPVGIVAGVIYALALRHRGRIGDAVAAHALTNGLLAVRAFVSGRWDLW